MRQRSAVRAVIRDGERILLLRRTAGRRSMRGQFELPGGRIRQDEQPEDTLRRTLYDGAGLSLRSVHLEDAVSYQDQDYRDIQYLVLVYQVDCAPGHHSVRPRGKYSSYKWVMLSELHQYQLTDSTSLLLTIEQQGITTDKHERYNTKYDDNSTTNDHFVIYSDGASRGNPGHSSAGFVILNGNQEVVEQGGEYLGITTNSQAEYHGVRLGLERALELGFKRVDFRVDNMMVVNQLNGTYRIKNRELWPIHERIKKLVGKFDSVHFSHVKREFNQLADEVVNQTLDQHVSQR